MSDFESKQQEEFEKFMLQYKPEFRDFNKVGDYTYSNSLTSIAYDSYLQGIKSQQAKIDELKMSNHHLSVQLIDSNTQYDHVKKERDELQGLADAALKSIMICEEYNHAEKLDEIYNILKAVEK